MREEQTIERLAHGLHQALCWSDGRSADWSAFRALFAPQAYLFPAGRPLAPLTVDEFIHRMDAQRLSGDLLDYQEKIAHIDVHLFGGGVAAAHIASDGLINKQDKVRTSGVMVFVKDVGKWQIVSMAWDKIAVGQGNISPLGCP